MELPEGDYDFSVANDGYGDSGQVRIRRDLVTTIDLNDYKGEGPKMCKVTFDVSVSGAVVTINGKKVNHKKPTELRYGVYQLGVYAEGYDAWTKQLVVNSPKAKIEILLSSQTEAASTETNTKSNKAKSGGEQVTANKSRSRAGSKAGSIVNESSSGSTTDQSVGSALADAALSSSLASIITGGDSTDYLDTLSGLVDSLDRLSGSKNNRSNENEEDGED